MKNSINFECNNVYIEKIKENSKLLLNRDHKLTNLEKLIYFSETRTGFLLLSLCTFFIYPLYYYFLYFEKKTFNDDFFNKEKQINFYKEKAREKVVSKIEQFDKKIKTLYKAHNILDIFKNTYSQTKIFGFKIIALLLGIFINIREKTLKKHEDQLVLFKDFQIDTTPETLAEERNEEENLREKLEKKLELSKPNSHDINFDFEEKVKKSLKTDFDRKWKVSNKNYDFFIFFIFLISYLFISIITLGIFPIYHIKKGWFNSQQLEALNTKKQSEYLTMEEFKNKIEKLTNNIKIDSDYSTKLIASFNGELKKKNNKILFKTKIFDNDFYKFMVIFLLMVLTCGFFGIYLLAKSTYIKKYDISIPTTLDENNEIKTIGRYHNWLQQLKSKLVYVFDFGYDLKIMTQLIANRKTINISNLTISPETPKDYVLLLIKTVTSPLFKWLFTILLFIGIIATGCLWITMEGFIISSIWFTLLIVFLVLFILGLSYHIFLLF